MEGFYKYENGTLAFAQTGIYQPNATYLVSEHTNYAFPIDGWYYCTSFDNALEFFGLEVKDDGALQELPVKIWQVRQLVTKYVLKSTLTTEEYTGLISIYPEWEVGKAYIDNEVCTYNGKLYEIVQPHTSQIGWEPDAVPALWKEITPPNVIPVWVQPTGGHDAYAKGAKVHFPTAADPVYESLIPANVYSPTAYPAGWKKL
jgi:hypothetical protein